MTHNNTSWSFIYVGQTGGLAERVNNHEKWNCWLKNRQIGGLFISFIVVSDLRTRLNIETELRKKLQGLNCNLQ
ncbi:MAG: hypothetical protein V1928_02675 [Parcubacteria group bacterium]